MASSVYEGGVEGSGVARLRLDLIGRDVRDLQAPVRLEPGVRIAPVDHCKHPAPCVAARKHRADGALAVLVERVRLGGDREASLVAADDELAGVAAGHPRAADHEEVAPPRAAAEHARVAAGH